MYDILLLQKIYDLIWLIDLQVNLLSEIYDLIWLIDLQVNLLSEMGLRKCTAKIMLFISLDYLKIIIWV